MTPQEKRTAIIEALIQETIKDGIEIGISSPKVKYFYLGSKSGKSHSIDKNSISTSIINKVEKNLAEYRESGLLKREDPLPSIDEDEPIEEALSEELDIESLSYKDFKKLKKEQEKEEKGQLAEEKRLIKIRKDAHKRGFDTGILTHFDDPEELYELSDEEITRMQAAGYINEDGFYNFVFPPDADSLKKEKLSTKKKLMIAGLAFFGGGILAWVFFSFYSTFSMF